MRRFGQIVTLAVATSFIAGCGRSCSRKSQEAPPPVEEAGKPEDGTEPQAEAKTPNYSGITVTRTVKKDVIDTKKGNTIKEGSSVSVRYTEWVYDPAALANQGPKIYSTDEGAVLLKVGEGKVIKGFEEALKGLHKGAKGQLIIPPDEAYGKTGQPPKIPPGAMVMINYEIVDVK